MTIVFLIDAFPPEAKGGAGTVTLRLAELLVHQGHQIHVVTTVANQQRAGTEILRGITIHRLYAINRGNFRFWRGLYNPSALHKLESVLVKIRPDVVHAHSVNNTFSWASLKVAKKYSEKVFFTAHDVLSIAYSRMMDYINPNDLSIPQNPDYRRTLVRQLRQGKKKFVPFRNLVIRHYLKRYTDKVFAVSHELKIALNQNGIQNVEVLYNGVDANEYDIPEPAREEFKHSHGLAGKKIILCAGRLMGSKGINQLVDALPIIATQTPEALLYLVGDSDADYTKHILDRCQKLGISENIRIESWIEEKSFCTAVAICDVLVVPSICFDTLTMAPEALAAKKPVVVTCFGGAKETVIEGISGFVVNPHNITSLAEKISIILKDDELARRMGAAGHHLALEKFSLQKQAERLIKAYAQVED